MVKGKVEKIKLSMPSIAVLLVLTTIAATSLAFVPATAQPVEVRVNASEYVEEGATFVATIDVDSVTDLNSAQFDLSFDPDVIEVSAVKDGEINGEEVPIDDDVAVNESTIRVFIMMPPGEGVSGSGYLAEIEFKVKGDEGDVSVLDISKGEGGLGDKKGASGMLFWINKKFKDELNDEEISDDLKEVFDDKGYRLENATPTVEVIQKDRFWDIIDFPNSVYGVWVESGVLKIFDKGEILANWIDAEITIGEEEVGEDEEEEEEVGEEVTPGSPNIIAWKPAEAVVGNAVGEPRAFNISVNQIADISWQINGTEVQTNETVTEAFFTNTSAVIGTWNVSAIATNTTTGLSDMHTWIWSVTLTPTATATPTPTLAPGVTPVPEAETEGTPTQTPTLAPRVTPTPTTSTPTPKPEVPGFEAVFAIAVLLVIAYILRRKRGEGR